MRMSGRVYVGVLTLLCAPGGRIGEAKHPGPEKLEGLQQESSAVVKARIMRQVMALKGISDLMSLDCETLEGISDLMCYLELVLAAIGSEAGEECGQWLDDVAQVWQVQDDSVDNALAYLSDSDECRDWFSAAIDCVPLDNIGRGTFASGLITQLIDNALDDDEIDYPRALRGSDSLRCWAVCFLLELTLSASDLPCDGLHAHDWVSMHRLLQFGRHLLGTIDDDPVSDPELTQHESTAVCPQGHIFKSELQAGYECDICKQDIPANERFFDCRTCDWSVCHECQKGGAAGPEQARVDSSPSGDDTLGLSLPGRQIASDNVSAFATGVGHDGDVQIACMKCQEVSVQGCMPRTGLPGAAARGGLPRRSYRRRPRRTSGAATRGGLPGRMLSWEVHHQSDGGMRCRIHSWEVHHQGDGVPRLGAPWPVRCWEVHHQGDGGRPRRIYSWEVHHQGDGGRWWGRLLWQQLFSGPIGVAWRVPRPALVGVVLR